MKKLLWFFLFWTTLAGAQVVGPGFVNYVTSAPSGACSQGEQQRNVLGNGQVWTCQSGTWTQVGGSGGSGITGTLTSGKIPVATGAHTLGDGSVTDNGAGAIGVGSASVAGSVGSVLSVLGTDSTILDVERVGIGSANTPAAAGFGLNYNSGSNKSGGALAALQVYSETDPGTAANITSGLNGLLVEVDHNGSGTVAQQFAGGFTSLKFGAGTITTNAAGDFFSGGLAGTITNDRTIIIESPQSGATFTNPHVGLYINDQRIAGVGQAIQVLGGASDLGPQATKVGALATGTNCAAVGTAASPSVASCSSAASGAFSCSTNASAATCTINTTAVTASSRVIVQESAAEGANLSVTCNTAPTVTPAILLASKIAATSFTINMPTITVNPACFVYWIVN